RLELILLSGDRFGAEKHGRRIPPALGQIENRPLPEAYLCAQVWNWIVRQMPARAISFAGDPPEVTPLGTHVIAADLSLEPSHVALRILPCGKGFCPRQCAEKRDEIWTGADVDNIKQRVRRSSSLKSCHGAGNHPVVIRMWLAIIVLEVGLGIEQRPIVVG